MKNELKNCRAAAVGRYVGMGRNGAAAGRRDEKIAREGFRIRGVVGCGELSGPAFGVKAKKNRQWPEVSRRLADNNTTGKAIDFARLSV